MADHNDPPSNVNSPPRDGFPNQDPYEPESTENPQESVESSTSNDFELITSTNSPVASPDAETTNIPTGNPDTGNPNPPLYPSLHDIEPHDELINSHPNYNFRATSSRTNRQETDNSSRSTRGRQGNRQQSTRSTSGTSRSRTNRPDTDRPDTREIIQQPTRNTQDDTTRDTDNDENNDRYFSTHGSPVRPQITSGNNPLNIPLLDQTNIRTDFTEDLDDTIRE